jgi:hypothetical protein
MLLSSHSEKSSCYNKDHCVTVQPITTAKLFYIEDFCFLDDVLSQLENL